MSFEINLSAQGNAMLIKLFYPLLNLSYNFRLKLNIYLQVFPSMNYNLVLSRQYLVMKQNIKIEGLQYSKMYKVQAIIDGGQKHHFEKTAFTYTPSKPNNQSQEEEEYNQMPDDSWRRQISQLKKRQLKKQVVKSKQELELSADEKLFSEPQALFSTQKRKKSHEISANNLSNSQSLIKIIGQAYGIVEKDKLHQYILKSRKCRNLNQFINEKNQQDKEEIVQKKYLLAQSMRLFGEVYERKQGMQFFKNSWNMGPFYSYDFNQKNIKKN